MFPESCQHVHNLLWEVGDLSGLLLACYKDARNKLVTSHRDVMGKLLSWNLALTQVERSDTGVVVIIVIFNS